MGITDHDPKRTNPQITSRHELFRYSTLCDRTPIHQLGQESLGWFPLSEQGWNGWRDIDELTKTCTYLMVVCTKHLLGWCLIHGQLRTYLYCTADIRYRATPLEEM